jgi:hypothetical protein
MTNLLLHKTPNLVSSEPGAAQRVDVDYVIFSKYYKEVRAEMLKDHYFTAPKDVALAKQAEPMGLTAQECASLTIRNRSKPKR